MIAPSNDTTLHGPSSPARVWRAADRRTAFTLLVFVAGCALPPRPEFRPADSDEDQAIQTWLTEGSPMAVFHSYVDDQVDITVWIEPSANPRLLECHVHVENGSPHDVVLDFERSAIEDPSGTLWTVTGPAYSIEYDAESPEWRVPAEEFGTFSVVFDAGPDRPRPTSFSVRLEGFIGSLVLSDSFRFTRINWP